MSIKNILYRFKRRLINQVRELKVSIKVEHESNSYNFDDAKKYWNNIPKSEGGNPWNSKELLKVDDKTLIEQFNKERKRTYRKEERITGYNMALSGINDIKSPYVMDYGSGVGFYGIEVLDKIRDSKVVFCDISESNLEIINRITKLLKFNNRAKTFLVKNKKSKDLNFDKKFDLILSMGVLHHSPYSKQIISNLKSFLRTDGIFLVMLYNKHYKKKLSLKRGYTINNETFGELTDPIGNGLKNPFSEDFDDKKVLELFGDDFNLIKSNYPTLDYNFYEFIYQPNY